MKKKIGLLLLLGLLSNSAGAADTSVPLGGMIKADPSAAVAQEPSAVDIRRIPIIQNILRAGGEIYYIGQRSGMTGFLLYKDGQVQVMYLPPDQQAVIFGGMYSIDGANISTQQIDAATAQNAQLKALLVAATEQQKELEKNGNFGAAAVAPEIAETKKNMMPGGSVALSPGERLFNDFLSAAGVVVGQANKPLVLMLVDPHCQFCKATWGELYEPLTKGVLRVKLVPIGAEGSENERQAARFLRATDPLETWNKFVGGDKSVLAGDPPATDISAVRANMAMVVSWKIQATPYLVYRGADGKVKVVQGKPEKIANVLADLKP